MRKLLLGILILLAPVAYAARTGGAVAAQVYLESGTLPAINAGVYTWNFHYKNANNPGTAAYSDVLCMSGGPAANYNVGFQWDRITDGASGYHRDSVGFKIAVTSGLVANTWYWIAGRYDGTNLKVYVNGTENATIAAAAPDRTDLTYNLVVLANKTGGTYAFEDDGNIEHLSWWPATSLTVAEIQSLAAGKHPTAVRASGLLGYWPLRGDDSPERDESHFTTAGYSLTLTNSPAKLATWPGAELLFQGLR